MKNNIKKNPWESSYPPNVCKEKKTPWQSLIRFVSFLKRFNVKKVVDVGCGYGAESIYLAKNGFEVLGIDINKDAINFAKDRTERIGCKAKFVCSDVLIWLKRAQSQSVDVVVDAAFSHAIKKKEREEHFREISRVLRNGGFLYLVEFSNFDPICRLLCPKRKWTVRKHRLAEGNYFKAYCHFFTKKEILSLLRKNGLKVLRFDAEKVGYPPKILKLQEIKKKISFRLFHFVFAQKYA